MLNYNLIKIIGNGNYGTVFKAKCIKTGQNVGIKFIEFEDGNEMLLRAICRELKINIFLSDTPNNVFTARLLD